MKNRTVLEVCDLRTRFYTPEGIVYAVNGITYELHEGETLAVVGESGCGKSVSMLSILGLIPIPPGQIASGSAMYEDQDLLKLTESELEDVRGNKIAMIFQDPMTALNPVLTIGRQITESLRRHMDMSQEVANTRAAELLDSVGIPDAEMGERVCAFVVCAEGKPVELSEIKSFLQAKGLARFKWPERMEVVESLPKVASGHKIDKKKLKETLLPRPSSGHH